MTDTTTRAQRSKERQMAREKTGIEWRPILALEQIADSLDDIRRELIDINRKMPEPRDL